jgi:hypothetical protein
MSKVRRRRRAPRPGRDVKDRLIQTRVPERLENVLREEAQKRRLSVSHLIRNILEDTLDLVDTVVSGAEGFVGGSVEFAGQVKRDAERLASTAREAVNHGASARRDTASRRARSGVAARDDIEPESGDDIEPESSNEPGPESDDDIELESKRSLEHVLAWNQVVVNKPVQCARCDCALPRGAKAHLGVSQDPTAPPAWLCDDCLAQVADR